MELVSIIIPTYNRSDKLCRAIDSALNQTYKMIEIVVVDDGSNDNTANVIRKYGDKIVYEFKQNGGVSSARNHGIRVSNGNLIAFLDSDDSWSENKIQKQVEFFYENPEFGLVLTNCCFCDASGEVTEKTNRRKYLPIDGYILEHVILKPSLIPSTAMVRSEVLKKVGVFDESLKTAEDIDLHLRISSEYKIGLIEEPLTQCLRGEHGLSQENNTYDDYVYVLERFLENKVDKVSRKGFKRSLFNTYLSVSNGKYWRGEVRLGLRYALLCFKNSVSLGEFYHAAKNIVKAVKYIFIK